MTAYAPTANILVLLGEIDSIGELTHTAKGVPMMFLRLKIKRHKDAAGTTVWRGCDKPEVVCFGRIAEYVAASGAPGDRIVVLAAIRISAWYRRTDQRVIRTQGLVAETVALSPVSQESPREKGFRHRRQKIAIPEDETR